MRAEVSNLNHCAVPFLSRAAVNLNWYDYNEYFVLIYRLLVLGNVFKGIFTSIFPFRNFILMILLVFYCVLSSSSGVSV